MVDHRHMALSRSMPAFSSSKSSSTLMLSPLERLPLAKPLPMATKQVQLTPRSQEACRRHGIDARELMPLKIEHFAVPGQSSDIQRLKWEHYEAARRDAFQLVQKERDRINAELVAKNIANGTQQLSRSDSSITSDSDSRGGRSTLMAPLLATSTTAALERERAQAEAMKKRQQTEIEGMLLSETRRAQLEEERQEKAQQQQETAARAQREKQQRDREWAAQRQKSDQEKKAEEARLAQEARRYHAKQLQREAARAQEEQQQAKERHAEMARRDADRAAKNEARLRRQQELYQEKQEEAARRVAAAAEKERRRIERVEEQRQRMVQEHARQREKANQRVEATLQQQAELTEQQRQYYVHRSELEEQRRELFEEARLAQQEQRRRASDEKLEQIKQLQQRVERENEERKAYYVHKQAEHDEMVRVIHERREETAKRRQAERDMNMYLKQVQYARNRRKDECRREAISEKIRLEAQRAEDLKEQKEQLVARTRLRHSQTAIVRNGMLERLETMKHKNAFYLPEEMRSLLTKPELLQLMQRCDEISANSGEEKVSPETFKRALEQLRAEHKLTSIDRRRPGTAPDETELFCARASATL